MDFGLKPAGVEKTSTGPSSGANTPNNGPYYDFSKDLGDTLDLSSNKNKKTSNSNEDDSYRGIGNRPDDTPSSGNSEIDDVLKEIHEAEKPILAPLPQPSPKKAEPASSGEPGKT